MPAMHCHTRFDESGRPVESRFVARCLTQEEHTTGWRVVAACGDAPSQLVGVFLLLAILAEVAGADIVATLPEPLRVAVEEGRRMVAESESDDRAQGSSAPAGLHHFVPSRAVA